MRDLTSFTKKYPTLVNAKKKNQELSKSLDIQIHIPDAFCICCKEEIPKSNQLWQASSVLEGATMQHNQVVVEDLTPSDIDASVDVRIITLLSVMLKCNALTHCSNKTQIEGDVPIQAFMFKHLHCESAFILQY
jgi:hypothetical protein